jgi:hypothetical protein
LDRDGASPATVVYPEFAQDRGDVMIDRSHGNNQAVRDISVRQAGGEQSQHLDLAGSQPGGVRGRDRPRSPGQVLLATVAQAAGNDGRGRSGTEAAQLFEGLA